MRAKKRLAQAILVQALADLAANPLQNPEKEFDRQVNHSTARAWLMGDQSTPVMRAAGINPVIARTVITFQPQVIAEVLRG